MNSKKQVNNALIFSDAHLKLEKVMQRDGRLYLAVLEKLFTIIQKVNPKYVFNLGDTFHNKDSVSATLLQIYKEFLERVTALGIEVVQIVGNHDFSVSSETQIYHALMQYQIPGVTIVNDVFKLNEDTGFMSYCRTKELFDARILKLGKINRLFAHLDINGFNLGDDYIEQYAILNPDDFSGIKEVYSGHYHEAQEKIINDTFFVYIGTPNTVNFGETDQDKRVVLLNLDSGQLESIPTDMTFHKTIKITAQDEYPTFDENEISRGCKFRLIVSGTPEELEIFKLKKPKNYPVNPIYDVIHSEKPRIELNDAKNQEDLLKKYTQEEIQRSYGSIEESGLDLERLLKIGKNKINEARNS